MTEEQPQKKLEEIKVIGGYSQQIQDFMEHLYLMVEPSLRERYNECVDAQREYAQMFNIPYPKVPRDTPELFFWDMILAYVLALRERNQPDYEDDGDDCDEICYADIIQPAPDLEEPPLKPQNEDVMFR